MCAPARSTIKEKLAVKGSIPATTERVVGQRWINLQLILNRDIHESCETNNRNLLPEVVQDSEFPGFETIAITFNRDTEAEQDDTRFGHDDYVMSISEEDVANAWDDAQHEIQQLIAGGWLVDEAIIENGQVTGYRSRNPEIGDLVSVPRDWHTDWESQEPMDERPTSYRPLKYVRHKSGAILPCRGQKADGSPDAFRHVSDDRHWAQPEPSDHLESFDPFPLTTRISLQDIFLLDDGNFIPHYADKIQKPKIKAAFALLKEFGNPTPGKKLLAFCQENSYGINWGQALVDLAVDSISIKPRWHRYVLHRQVKVILRNGRQCLSPDLRPWMNPAHNGLYWKMLDDVAVFHEVSRKDWLDGLFKGFLTPSSREPIEFGDPDAIKKEFANWVLRAMVA
jgi:hypothetical protein